MKVYVVTKTDYYQDITYVVKIFLSEVKARLYVESKGNSIYEEYEYEQYEVTE